MPEAPFLIDLSEQLLAIKQELLTELRTELRADHDRGRWMNARTAAAYLDTTLEGIQKLVARNQIPYSQEAPGCRLLFDRHAIDDWLTNTSHHPPR
jgi:hypothetical protein